MNSSHIDTQVVVVILVLPFGGDLLKVPKAPSFQIGSGRNLAGFSTSR